VNNPVWKTLWKIVVPSKIKIFIWRALHGILPLKCLLANQHIGTSSECPICGQGPEDIRHLLFLCPMAQELWQALGLHEIIAELAHLDYSGSLILEKLLRRNPGNLQGFDDVGLLEVIVITCWYRWWIRRWSTNNELVPPIFRCKMSILAMAAHSKKASSKPLDNGATSWSRPLPRQVKINVDAAFCADQAEGAVGVVARDYKGQFIAAATRHLPHVSSVMMAEALAMKDGLSLANRLGCNSVLAESDSLEMIQACSGEEH
jgi:hypothetical protein